MSVLLSVESPIFPPPPSLLPWVPLHFLLVIHLHPAFAKGEGEANWFWSQRPAAAAASTVVSIRRRLVLSAIKTRLTQSSFLPSPTPPPNQLTCTKSAWLSIFIRRMTSKIYDQNTRRLPSFSSNPSRLTYKNPWIRLIIIYQRPCTYRSLVVLDYNRNRRLCAEPQAADRRNATISFLIEPIHSSSYTGYGSIYYGKKERFAPFVVSLGWRSTFDIYQTSNLYCRGTHHPASPQNKT